MREWSTLRRLMLLKGVTGGAVEEATVTGNPVTFLTDLARPLKSLLVNLLPVQSGSGATSPQNIRPIVAWDGVTVWHSGKNLYDEETYPIIAEKWINGDTGITVDNSPAWSCTPFIPCEEIAGRTVTLNKRPHGNLPGVAFYTGQSSQNYISGLTNGNKTKNTPWTFEVPANAKYMRFTVEPGTTEIQIELGSSATAYEPYQPITETDISFPSPVYGGTLDVVSGVLTVEYIAYTFTANDNLSKYGTYTGGIRLNSTVLDNTKENGVSSVCNIAKRLNSVPSQIDSLCYRISGGTSRTAIFVPDSMFDGGATVDKFKEWLSENEFTICAELVTPLEIPLIPEQITAIKGNNTVWSDADGSMTATYLKKG